MPQFLNKKYIILDSAGIRKPGSRTSGAETFATYHTIEAAHAADVICLVVDGSEPLTHQDQVVAGICKEAKKGVVVIANKADLVDKMGRKIFEKSFYDKFSFLKVEKFLWVSAQSELDKQKSEKANILLDSDNQNSQNLQNSQSHISLQNANNLAKNEIEKNLTKNLENIFEPHLEDSLEHNYQTNLETTLQNQKTSSEIAQVDYNKEIEQMKTNLQLEIDKNLEEKNPQNTKKLLKSAKNLEKMKKELEKNLEETKLGEFLPENGIASIWRAIDGSLESRQKDIDPEVVRKLFNYLMKHKDKRPVKLRMQKKPVIYDFLYTKNSPPTFELLVRDKMTVHWSYLRFLENVVRSQFGLKNTGITIKVVEVKKSKVLG